jgi:lipopolysaccharide export system protein LptA
MFTLHPSPLLLAAVLAAGVGVAAAEKADRSKPMALESDQPCTLNLLKQTSVCSGNVVISQGTLQIRADRLELRESPEGYQMAQAIGVAGKPASYRQKRDRPSASTTTAGPVPCALRVPPWCAAFGERRWLTRSKAL